MQEVKHKSTGKVLHEVHSDTLIGTNLRGADLCGADLRGANLREAHLRGADLRGAKLTDGDWVPIIPNIHKAVLAAVLKPEALDMETWHTCETTHCWAGWIVKLAGSGGRVMEGLLGTGTAAGFILMASDSALERIPNWISSDEVAMLEIKRLAARDLSQQGQPDALKKYTGDK